MRRCIRAALSSIAGLHFGFVTGWATTAEPARRQTCRRAIGRVVAGMAATALTMLTVGAQPAQAASYTCTVTGTAPTLTVSLTLQGAPDEAYTITRSAGGVLQVNGAGCTGDPLVANIGQVTVQGQIGKDQTLALSQADGLLENSAGTDIAFTANLGDGTDALWIITTDVADTIRLGRPGLVQTVDFGNDPGSANVPAARGIERYEIRGSGGNDDISAAGGGDVGATGAVDVPVTIVGGDGMDSVAGGSAGDLLLGDAGDDTLIGDTGTDELNGGDGDDLLRGGDGNDTIRGGPDVTGDTLDFAGAAAGVKVDLAAGRAESLAAATGIDDFAGIENVTGSPRNDVIFGDSADNVLDGAGGNDTVDYSQATGGVTGTLPSVGHSATASGDGVGTDTLRNMEGMAGSPFADTATGSTAPNTINGGAGDDTIVGGDEAPAARVTGGRLALPGAPGNYASSPDSAALTTGGTLEIRAKVAVTDWTPSARQFIVSKTRDFNYSTTGSYGLALEPWGALTFLWFEDTFGGGSISVSSNVLPAFSSGSQHWVRVVYSEDIVASSRNISFSVCTENAAAPFPGQTCDEPAEFTAAGAISGFLFGSGLRDGSDELRLGDLSGTEMLTGDIHRVQQFGPGGAKVFDADFASVPDDAAAFSESSSNGATVTVHSLRGDLLSGDAGDDSLTGGLGLDVVNGGGGDDSLHGDLGDDTINGGDGNDRMAGGGGNDTINGAQGTADVADYSADAGPVAVDLSAGTASGAGSDLLANVEHVTGTAAGDTLAGDDGDNRLVGGDGADTLTGLDGDDSLLGGTGTDAVGYSGATSSVTVDLSEAGLPQNTRGAGLDIITAVESVTGSSYDDVLTGSTGANVLLGMAGADLLTGGPGDDTLDGGADVDTADYSSAPGPVTAVLVGGNGTATGAAGNDTLTSIQQLTGAQVNRLNSPPVAEDDGYATLEDSPLAVGSPGVLANDTDADGDSLQAGLTADASHGTVTLRPGGAFAYTPDANWNGLDSFTYSVTDGHGGAATAVGLISVAPVDDPPATVGFAGVAPSVQENAGTVTLTVRRSGNTAIPARVDYGITGGTATPDADVTLTAGTVSFATGQTSAKVTVTVTDDTERERAETAVVTLTNPGPETVLGAADTATLTVRVSDQQPDAMVSTASTTGYLGDDLYNTTGIGQTKTVKARRGTARTFYIRVANDGNATNTFTVRGSASAAGSAVTYYSGTTDITTALRSTAGWSVTLDPGDSKVIRMRIKVLSTAAVGSLKAGTVSATWAGDGTRTDLVKGVARAT